MTDLQQTNKVKLYLRATDRGINIKGVSRVDMWRCFECRGKDDPYMIHNRLWLAAWPTAGNDRSCMRTMMLEMFPERFEPIPNNPRARRPKYRMSPMCILCLPCQETLLGRHLVLTDFQELPINSSILFAHKMGARSRQ